MRSSCLICVIKFVQVIYCNLPFSKLVDQRDRIIHSFQITGPGPNPRNEQLLATKVKGSGEQFIITRNYLIEFIQLNDELSDLLYVFRDQLDDN